MKRFIECCCTSLFEAMQAQEGGASRIELCSRLEVGGLTPPISLIEDVVKEIDIPINILIRIREGNFVYTSDEIMVMRNSIESIVSSHIGEKINGFVVGALRDDGSIDTQGVDKLISPILHIKNITFHRAFDQAVNPIKSLEDIISLGCDRLLTSGQKNTAFEGRELISLLIKESKGKITIMPGCGVRVNNITQIEQDTQASEFHSSAHGNNGQTDKNIVKLLTTV